MNGRYAVLGAFVLLGALFLQRPWFFDDPSVIVTARAAAADPLRPYDYRLDLGTPEYPNWVRGEGPAYSHPPLSAWVLGAVMRLAGEREIPLHAVMLAITAGALGLVFRLARQCGLPPAAAGALTAFSPTVFLSSLTLYPHVFYWFFYLASLSVALQTRNDPSMRNRIGVGLLLVLAFLSLDHWPVLVLLVLGVLRRRSGIPAVIFLAAAGRWAAWEFRLYGDNHFWANLRVRGGGPYPWRAVFLPAVYLAGGLPFVAVAWPFLARRSRTAALAIAALALASGGLFSGPAGGFTLLQSGLLALFLSTGVGFLASLPFLWKENPDGPWRLIIGWMGVEFLFIQKFLVYPTGHHLLPLCVPAAFLALRMISALGWGRAAQGIGIGAMAVLTLALAHADLTAARVGPQMAAELSRLKRTGYYWGNDFSGFSYYLKRAGWRPYDHREPLPPGELLVIPTNFNVQGAAHFLQRPGYARVGERRYWTLTPWRTFSIGDSAGWYSASWGALPYALSRRPVETFYLFQGTEPQREPGAQRINRHIQR